METARDLCALVIYTIGVVMIVAELRALNATIRPLMYTMVNNVEWAIRTPCAECKRREATKA